MQNSRKALVRKNSFYEGRKEVGTFKNSKCQEVDWLTHTKFRGCALDFVFGLIKSKINDEF